VKSSQVLMLFCDWTEYESQILTLISPATRYELRDSQSAMGYDMHVTVYNYVKPLINLKTVGSSERNK